MSTNEVRSLESQIAEHLKQDVRDYDYQELALLTRRYRAHVVGESSRTFWQEFRGFLSRVGAALAACMPKWSRQG